MISHVSSIFLLASVLGVEPSQPTTSAPPTSDPPVTGQPSPVVPPQTAPAPASSAAPTPSPALPAISADAPFEVENLGLSSVLKIALEENLDLRQRVVEVSLSEASILSSLGVFDLRFTSGLGATLSEDTPRGSAFIFNTGSRSITSYLGLSRALETGGSISLRLDLGRTQTKQPISFFNPALGSTTLASYTISPTLTFTHPLLKGMGLEVNRTAIKRAELASSQAEAATQSTAQDLVRDLVSAYWDVLFAKRDLINKRQSVALAKEQFERTQAQVRAGRLAPIELKAVEQSLAARESEVLVAENQLLDTSLTLRTFMGQEFAEREVLGVLPSTDPAAFQPKAIDVKHEIDRALKSNPQIRQLELALSSRRVDELEAANNRLPQLDFTGQFIATGRSVDTAPDPSRGQSGQQGSWGEAFGNFFNEDVAKHGILAQYTVMGNLDFTWDIQNRFAKGEHQRVLQQIRQAELNLKQTRQMIATAVIRAANSIRTAAKRMEVNQISVELAEENLRAEQARFAVGRSTNYDVLFRIDELAKSQANALNAQIEYLKGLVSLQALNGEILPAYGLELPQ